MEISGHRDSLTLRQKEQKEHGTETRKQLKKGGSSRAEIRDEERTEDRFTLIEHTNYTKED
jgi:hypothetical protein